MSRSMVSLHRRAENLPLQRSALALRTQFEINVWKVIEVRRIIDGLDAWLIRCRSVAYMIPIDAQKEEMASHLVQRAQTSLVVRTKPE